MTKRPAASRLVSPLSSIELRAELSSLNARADQQFQQFITRLGRD